MTTGLFGSRSQSKFGRALRLCSRFGHGRFIGRTRRFQFGADADPNGIFEQANCVRHFLGISNPGS